MKVFSAKAILVTLLFFNTAVLPHGQEVHQYIAVEAYKLLQQYGYQYPAIENHLGGIGEIYAGEYPWQKGLITAGAWREDLEDVVFNYDVIYLPGVNYALVSITHFWDADNGDMNKNYFNIKVNNYLTLTIGPYENSYDKFMRYANGNWVLWFPELIQCINTENGHSLVITPLSALPPKKWGISVSYDTLKDFYNNKKLNLLWNQYSSYKVYDINTAREISPESVSGIVVEEWVRERIAWEVLGRMCHLLGDMSVPAHAHNDEHGMLADSYESWMSGSDDPYLFWNHQNSGDFINTEDLSEPLHYLFYTAQQQTDHFGSNGPGSIGNGDDVFGGAPRSEELSFLNSLNIASFGNPTTYQGPWDTSGLENIRNKTFPYAIRAAAGLLYWFASGTGLVGVNSDPVHQDIAGFKLLQNYPNPFNPKTTLGYSLPENSYVVIKIYDILGREIETLVKEEQPSGTYELAWNAADLPDGVYFYRLQASPKSRKSGGFVETKKMILMK